MTVKPATRILAENYTNWGTKWGRPPKENKAMTVARMLGAADRDVFAVWQPWQATAFETWLSIGRAVTRRSGEAAHEWSNFLVSRIQQDMALQQQLMSCHAPADAQRLVAGFFERAADDYRQEFQRLGDLATRMSGEIAEAIGTESRNRS